MYCPKYILDILNIYNKNGYEAYVVGGCVRDAILGRKCHDYDIATNALPEKTIELFDHVIPTGIKHGTVTIMTKTAVEVTTFRKESQYKDHRHPDEVAFVSTIEEDLSRRDFTVNAMAYHPNIGYIDPYGGKEDLKNKMIRCVGNPDLRFQEDALRMMRAYRFCAQLKFDLDTETKKAIQRNKYLIHYVSVERIRAELTKILEYDPYVVEEMVDLLEPWIPELKTSLNCEQNTKYHFCNVLHHCLFAVKLLQEFDETSAYALLLHDLGKPEAKKTDENGVDHFKEHPEISYEIAKRVCRVLKLSTEQQKTIPKLVLYHEEWFYPKIETVYKYRVEMGWTDTQLRQLLEVRRCDMLAHSELGQKTMIQILMFRELYNECIRRRPMYIKDLAINGQDILEHTSLRGKDIQDALNQCLKICFYNPDKNNKEYLLESIKASI